MSSPVIHSGFAVVLAENPAGVRNHLGIIPGKRLCQLLGAILCTSD